ncbi:putative non-ribosomal peptide synthetase domain protein [Burkholderia pseudomallei NAU20B-16]|nr:hypothetical protein [Burkholderia pseudomallei]AHE32489.1 putative non-ribosomal peptide synthetase domain protein [Burkholderia pseudomallei NAU20B-16]
MGEAARGVDGVDELLEGELLVLVGVEQALPGLQEQGVKGEVRVDAAAQDEGVDEEADDRGELGARAVGDGGADDDVGGAGEPGEESGEGGLEDHEEGGLPGGGELEEVAVPGGVEVPDDLPAAMIGESGPGAIEGQVVDGGQIV